MQFFIFFILLKLGSIELSIDDSVDLAIKNNEKVKISLLSYEKSIAKYKETRSLAYPKITANLDWTNYIIEPIARFDMPPELGGETIEAKVKMPYEINMGATLKQVLWTFGKVSSAIELSKHYREANFNAKDISINEVTYNSKLLYYTSLYTRELIKIAKESYKNAIENKKALKSKFRRLSRFDNLKMSADVSSRVPALNSSNNAYINSIIYLTSYIGLSKDESIVLNSNFIKDFPKLKLKDLEEKLIKNEPNLKTLASNKKVNKSLTNYKKAAYYPDLGAFLNYAYTGDSNKLFVGNTYLNNNLTFGISFTQNLWDSGERNNQYKQALYDYKISELEYTLTKKNLISKLKTAYTDYFSLIKTYEANKEYEELSKETYKVSLSSFISGKLTQMDLNDVEIMYTSSKISSLKTLFDINTTLILIDKLTNTEEKL